MLAQPPHRPPFNPPQLPFNPQSPTFQRFSLNELILACHHSPCLQGSILNSISQVVRPVFSHLTTAHPTCPDQRSRSRPDLVGVTTCCHFKSFSCNTCGPPGKCCKQGTYGRAKSFGCNIYRKQGGCPSKFRHPTSVPLQPNAFGATIRKRHGISSRSGETTPLSPVSKSTRADFGNWSTPLPVTAPDQFGVASRAWVHRSNVGL